MDVCGIAFGAGCVPTAPSGRSSHSPSSGLVRRITSRGRRRNARPSGFTAWSRADPPPTEPAIPDPRSPAARRPAGRPACSATGRRPRARQPPAGRRLEVVEIVTTPANVAVASMTPACTDIIREKRPLEGRRGARSHGRRVWTAPAGRWWSSSAPTPAFPLANGSTQRTRASAALPGRVAAGQARQGPWRGRPVMSRPEPSTPLRSD